MKHFRYGIASTAQSALSPPAPLPRREAGRRWLVLMYGVVNYVCFLAVFLYLLGFVGGFAVPTRLDGELRGSWPEALLVNSMLVLVFGLQHSVMARPGFKRRWARFVPSAVERSTYVLFTNLALALLFWQWRPMGGVVWDLQQPLARGLVWSLFGTGWLTVLVTTCLINHFDLFGLRQVWLEFRGRPYTHLSFRTPGPYRIVRHPLYVGWLLAFWATPTMTAAHLVFALAMTAYILVAIRYEERDLVRFHHAYAEYRRRVPMLIPRLVPRPRLASPSLAEDDQASARLRESCRA